MKIIKNNKLVDEKELSRSSVFFDSVLSDSEIATLAQALNEAPEFARYSSKELGKFNKRRGIICLRSKMKEMIGVATHRPISRNWEEFTTFYVFPKFRGKGFGGMLWRKTTEKLANKNIFLVTTNSKVKAIAEKSGFIKKGFVHLPNKVINFFIIQRIRISKIIDLLKRTGKKKIGSGFDYFVKLQ